eukprot:9496593-Pyramimonas_sp.AAC.1
MAATSRRPSFSREASSSQTWMSETNPSTPLPSRCSAACRHWRSSIESSKASKRGPKGPRPSACMAQSSPKEKRARRERGKTDRRRGPKPGKRPSAHGPRPSPDESCRAKLASDGPGGPARLNYLGS